MGMRQSGGSNGPTQKLRPDTLKRVAASFRPYRREVAFTIFLVVVSVVFSLLPAWFLRVIVDEGLSKNNLPITARFSIYTILVTIAASLLTIGYRALSVDVGQRILRDFRNRLFVHLQGMSLRFFTSNRTGEIQSRLMSDVSGVQSVVSDVVSNAISNVGIVVASMLR